MKRGFNKICPQCAGSPIFKKYIKTYNKCKKCGLKLSDYKSDDGPAYITIFIVGHILIPIISEEMSLSRTDCQTLPNRPLIKLIVINVIKEQIMRTI